MPPPVLEKVPSKVPEQLPQVLVTEKPGNENDISSNSCTAGSGSRVGSSPCGMLREKVFGVSSVEHAPGVEVSMEDALKSSVKPVVSEITIAKEKSQSMLTLERPHCLVKWNSPENVS